MSYIKIKKISKEDVETPEKGYIYFGFDDPSNGPWIKDDDGSDAYYIFSGYDSEPKIISVNPINSAFNGDTITINGTNFIPSITSVNFDDKMGLDVNVLSVTQLTVIVPSDITGNVSITVSTLYGDSLPYSYSINYKNSAPVISSITPVSTSPVGSEINISGYNFIAGDTMAVFNGVSVSTNVNNSTYLSVIIPDIPLGDTVIFLETSNGSGNLFNYNVTASINPTFTDFYPKTANIGDTISLSGTNFEQYQMPIFFGDKYASNITYVNSTYMTADVSSGTPFGKTTIKLGSNSLSGFVVTGSTATLLPTIDTILPLTQSIGNTVYINGTNLEGDLSVTFSDVPAIIVSNTSSSCSVIIDSGTTSGENSVVIINKYGSSNIFQYTIPSNIYEPIISSFLPTRDYRGRPINLYGDNFIEGTGNAVFYGNILAAKMRGYTTGTTEYIKTEIAENTPTGIVDIKVVNANGSYIKSGFEVVPSSTPPTITYVTPFFAKENDTIDVYGNNLTDGLISFGLSYSGTTGQTTTITDTHLRTTLPKIIDTAGSNEYVNVYVTTLSGTSTYSPLEVYTLPTTSPIIQSFSPLSGVVGTLVTISGNFYSKYYTELSIYINNVFYALDSQEYISETEMRGVIPNVGGYTGTAFLYVKTSAGSNQKAGFTVI